MDRYSIRELGRGALDTLVSLGFCILSLSLAANTYKKYYRMTKEGGFPGDLKDAIQSTLPWAAAAFLILYLVWRAAAVSKRNSRGVPRYVLFLASYGAALNLISAGRGTAVFAVMNISLVYLALFRLVGKAATKAFKGIGKVVSLFSTYFLRRISSAGGKNRLRLLYLLMLFLTAFLADSIWLESQNTLIDNGRWENNKVFLSKGAMGAVSFLTTRPALHRNRLDLGVWHGFHEVQFKERVDFENLSFNFRLPRTSYFSFIHGRSPEGFFGIRISRHPKFRNLVFSAEPDGGFLRGQPLDVPALEEGWNRFHFSREGELYVNDTLVAHVDGGPPGAQTIGFRGCYRQSLIDDITVFLKGSREPIREDFSSRRDPVPAFAIALAVLLSIHGLAFLVLRPLGNRSRIPRIFPLFTLALVLFVAVALFFLADHFYLSFLHPLKVDFHGYQTAPETSEEVVEKIRRRYPEKYEPSVCRILFTGTSQTWGAGAAKDEDVWVRRIEGMLNGLPGREVRYECINTGISGLRSYSLLDIYRREWRALEPRFVVINLSNNDRDPEVLSENLRAFVSLNRSMGARTLFLLEPVTLEKNDPSLLDNHEAMRVVARDEGIPLVDMCARLSARWDEGFLWWDSVHLTSFGQKLFAEELFGPLLEWIDS